MYPVDDLEVTEEPGPQGAGSPMEIPAPCYGGLSCRTASPSPDTGYSQESSDRVLADREMVIRHAEGADILPLPVVSCRG
jgi:hypothetical protein